MINHLTYGGVSTRDFNTWISGEAVYDSPERDVSYIKVPGRSGDLVIDNKRYNNITIRYPAFIKRDFDRNFNALREYLYSVTGYQRITDTYHPDKFRMGMFSGQLSPKTTSGNREGTFELAFNCKPYRYLKSGEVPETFTASGSILNRTLYDAAPLIRVYGKGNVGIGDKTITVSKTSTYVDIDCETGDAYKDDTNCNGDVTMPESVTLKPGLNGISLGTGITKIEITPRWRTI